jgi:hypothetical protein
MKMDSVLADFLDEDDRHHRHENGKKKVGIKGKNRVEGVWITVRNTSPPSHSIEGNGSQHHDEENQKSEREPVIDVLREGGEDVVGGGEEEEDEMDEMIWWAWDAGKINGFVDW